MVPSLTELILLIVIVLCIFGLGKIGDISERIGQMRADRARGVSGPDAVELPPQKSASNSAHGDPKPGTREPPVDEAQFDDDEPHV